MRMQEVLINRDLDLLDKETTGAHKAISPIRKKVLENITNHAEVTG
jgi:hypothetical protein